MLDGFERRITRQLKVVQAPVLVGVRAEIVEFQKLVNYLQASKQSEKNQKEKVEENAVRDISLRRTDNFKKGSDIAPTLGIPLSTPNTTGATIIDDVLKKLTGLPLRIVGTDLRVPMMVWYEMAPRPRKFVLEPYFTFLNSLGIF